MVYESYNLKYSRNEQIAAADIPNNKRNTSRVYQHTRVSGEQQPQSKAFHQQLKGACDGLCAISGSYAARMKWKRINNQIKSYG